MEPLEIRDRRFRLQQEIKSLDKQIAALQKECPHEHTEEDADKGLWRCRDCHETGELEAIAVTEPSAEASKAHQDEAAAQE